MDRLDWFLIATAFVSLMGICFMDMLMMLLDGTLFGDRRIDDFEYPD